MTTPVVQAVRRDLRRLPAADRRSALALSALTLAQLLDAVGDTDPDKRLGQAAQAARELRATMSELLKGAPRSRSAIDDLRARRAARARKPAAEAAESAPG